MDFRAGAAGAGCPHFPEIVFLITQNNPGFIPQNAFPNVPRFLIEGHTIGFVALENRHVNTVFGQLENLRQQFPRPFQGFFFEVITKAPVAQHLKHGVVVGVEANVFEVVVFARHAQAFLSVGHAARGGCSVSEEKIFKLRHTRVIEHQGGVIFGHKRGRSDNQVLFRAKKVEELAAYFGGSHGESARSSSELKIWKAVTARLWRAGIANAQSGTSKF